MGVNTLTRKALQDVGISEERDSLPWASAAEAPRFVRLITKFTA
jgi:coenzyme F420-reducing hydrogenase delta subunit